MSQKTLLKAYDVIRHYPMRGTADPGLLKDHLVVQEELLALNLLGWDFYSELLDLKIDHSSTESYSPETEYAEGDQALHLNVIYVALQTTTANQPPSAEHWVEAPDFEDEDFETLWARYLRPTLAWKVAQTAMPFSHYQMGSTGIQKSVPNNSEPISRTELSDLTEAGLREGAQWEKVLDSWIKRQTHEKFDKYAGRTTEQQNRRRRRKNFGFNLE